jgi:hypothetical protein
VQVRNSLLVCVVSISLCAMAPGQPTQQQQSVTAPIKSVSGLPPYPLITDQPVVLHTPQPAPVRTESQGAGLEADSAYIKHVNLGRGKEQAIVSQTPLNYQAADGTWRPIDPRFETAPGGFINAKNSLEIHAAARSTSLKLRLGTSGLIGWEPQSVVMVAGDHLTPVATPLDSNKAETATLSADGRTINYPQAWSLAGLSASVTSAAGQVEQNLVFARAPVQANDPGMALELRAVLRLMPGYTLRADGARHSDAFTTSNELQILDPQDVIALVLPAARVYEQGRPSVGVAARYRLAAQGDGSWLVAVETPAAWWLDPARHYPVVLDPLMQVQRPLSTAEVFDNSYCNPLVFGQTPGTVGVGRDRLTIVPGLFCETVVRALIRFDNLSSLRLPPGAVLQKAELLAVPTGGYLQSFNGIAFGAAADTQVYNISSTWDANTVIWNTQPSTAPAPVDSGLLSFLPNTSGQQLYLGHTFLLQNGSNGMVTNWLNSNNNGLELRARPDEEAGCTANWDCHFIEIPPINAWTDNQQNFATAFVGAHGGFMLAITYQAPTLAKWQPYTYANPALPPTADSDPYHNTYHAYALPPIGSSQWLAIGVKGFRIAKALNPSTTLHGIFSLAGTTTPAFPIGAACNGDFGAGNTYCGETLSNGDNFDNASNFVLVNSAFANNIGGVRVHPLNNSGSVNEYVVEAAPSINLPAPDPVQVYSDGYVFTQTFDLSTTHIISVFNLPLLEKTSVAIKLSTNIIYSGALIKPTPAQIRVFPPGGGVYPKTVASQIFNSNDPYGHFSLPFMVPAGKSGNYALVVEYPGDTTAYYYGEGGSSDPYTRTLSGQLVVRMCPLNAIATDDGCEFMLKPHDIGQPGGTPYYDVPPYRIYSEGGFTYCCTGTVLTNKTSAGHLYTPYITWAGDTSRMVVNAQDPVVFSTNIVNSLHTSGIIALGIDPPGYITMPLVLWRGDATASFDGSGFLTRVSPCSIPLQDCAELPLTGQDQGNVNLRINVAQDASHTQYAEGTATLNRPVESSPGIVQTITLPLTWRVLAEGYAGRPDAGPAANGPIYTSVYATSEPAQVDIASMFFVFDSQNTVSAPPSYWSMDYGKDPSYGPVFTVLHDFGKIGHSAALGGAWDWASLVIMPYGETGDGGGGVDACPTGYCLDLRDVNGNRNWRMPDVKVSNYAKTVVVSRAGQLNVWSTDHPSLLNAPQAPNTTQNFSFDTFKASVSVDYAVCPLGGDQHRVQVIHGETQMAFPGLGSADDPSQGISATFTLCESALRQVGLAFHTDPGLPVGDTGIFVDGISGLVTIDPDHTEIQISASFNAGTGDPKLVVATAQVTIDTRGLFDMQAKGRILATLDASGHAWVAWNPLDIGVDVGVYFPKQLDDNGNDAWLIRGQAHAHTWQGQGWQHKYNWLPDNGEQHLSASIVAELRIKKGQIFSWWFFDLPPSDVSIGYEVAFGQFCTNDNCTQYQWGIKGALILFGYDVGLYLNLECDMLKAAAINPLLALPCFSFILGSDSHILIDQLHATNAQSPRVNGEPVALNQRMAASPLAALDSEPLTITANTGSFLVALTWAHNAPTLTLVRPDNTVISVTNATSFGISTTATAQSILFGVRNPAPGTWHALIGHATPGDDYHLIFFANRKAPSVQLLNPTASETITAIGDATAPQYYTIHWSPGTPTNGDPNLRISLYYSATNSTALTDTQPVGGMIRENLPLTLTQYNWDITYLARGKYTVYARIADDPSVRATLTGTNQTPATPLVFAPGTLTYVDNNAPPAPTNVSMMLLPLQNAAQVCWDVPSAHDLSGYLFSYQTYDIYVSFTPVQRSQLVLPRVRYDGPGSRQCERVTGLSYGIIGFPFYTVLPNVAAFAMASYDASGNVSGFTSVSGFPAFVPQDISLPPAALTLTGTIGAGYAVHLTWNSDPNASSYNVYYAQDRSAGPSVIATGALQGSSPIATSATGITLTGLLPGHVVHFKVRALTAGGQLGPLSNEVALLLTNGVSTHCGGLPDDWCNAHGVTSPNADNDCDGLTNAEEFTHGTDPNNAYTSGTNYTDGELVALGINPLSSTIPVTMPHLPQVGLSSNHLVFNLYTGGPNITVQSIAFFNARGGVLTPSVSVSGSAWLTAALAGKTLLVSVNKTGLPAGHYGGLVTVGATGRYVGCARPVTVEVWLAAGNPPIGTYRAWLPGVMR